MSNEKQEAQGENPPKNQAAKPKQPTWLDLQNRIDEFRSFTETDGLIHTSKGYIDPSDRQDRGFLD